MKKSIIVFFVIVLMTSCQSNNKTIDSELAIKKELDISIGMQWNNDKKIQRNHFIII
ncbi:MAG: hypothetical protein PF485_05730 [Bacteroidales bacterium]|nr:hypothetical protein [Bacteroidales bacterium]